VTAGVTAFSLSVAHPTCAAEVATPAPNPRFKGPVSEAMQHAVVRLESPVGQNSFTAGTGFFYGFFSGNGQNVPAIVTNKHVIAGQQTCRTALTLANSDGTPNIDQQIIVMLNDLQSRAILHPQADVDLAILPIGDLIPELTKQGKKPYLITCDDTSIPTDQDFMGYSPLEDILTVGFPGFMWDTKHNLPIFHHGITATPAYVDFQGKREFLIDAAIWPGASGSPVFLYDQGMIYNARQNSAAIGTRAYLLGIIYATVIQDVTGNILMQAAPTTPHVNSSVPSNLGVCIRATRIFDFQRLLIDKGAKVPADYKVRAGGAL